MMTARTDGAGCSDARHHRDSHIHTRHGTVVCLACKCDELPTEGASLDRGAGDVRTSKGASVTFAPEWHTYKGGTA
jgi:hypothetical protein